MIGDDIIFILPLTRQNSRPNETVQEAVRLNVYSQREENKKTLQEEQPGNRQISDIISLLVIKALNQLQPLQILLYHSATHFYLYNVITFLGCSNTKVSSRCIGFCQGPCWCNSCISRLRGLWPQIYKIKPALEYHRRNL